MPSHLRPQRVATCLFCQQAGYELEAARSTIATMDHDIAELDTALRHKTAQVEALEAEVSAMEIAQHQIEQRYQNLYLGALTS